MMKHSLRKIADCKPCPNLCKLQTNSVDKYLCESDPEYEVGRKVVFADKEEFEAKGGSKPESPKFLLSLKRPFTGHAKSTPFSLTYLSSNP